MTACATYRASNEKRAFSSHDVCQGQDSCGFQGAQVVKSGTRSPLRETPSQHTPAQSHSHPFLRSLPWSCVSCMISVLCLAELLQYFSRFHVVSCFTAFSARQLSVESSVFTSSPLHGDPGVLFNSLSHKTTNTSTLTPQWPPCTCDLVAEYRHC